MVDLPCRARRALLRPRLHERAGRILRLAPPRAALALALARSALVLLGGAHGARVNFSGG